jgi:hypothetical protein
MSVSTLECMGNTAIRRSADPQRASGRSSGVPSAVSLVFGHAGYPVVKSGGEFMDGCDSEMQHLVPIVLRGT